MRPGRACSLYSSFPGGISTGGILAWIGVGTLPQSLPPERPAGWIHTPGGADQPPVRRIPFQPPKSPPASSVAMAGQWQRVGPLPRPLSHLDPFQGPEARPVPLRYGAYRCHPPLDASPPELDYYPVLPSPAGITKQLLHWDHYGWS